MLSTLKQLSCKKKVQPYAKARVKKLGNSGGGQELTVMVRKVRDQNFNETILGKFVLPYPGFTRNQHKIHLNCY